jgi:murein DD-endopeptidase MepM/ murein hydrolase activator NlpD
LRIDSRGPSDRHAHLRLHHALASVLAVPVIALVIGESLARRFWASRPALLSVGLVAVTLAVSALPIAPIDAASTSAESPTVDRDIAAIDVPIRTPDPDRPVVDPPARPVSQAREATPIPEPPAVVRFRPRNGWTDVSRFAAVSVRFTRPMDHESTERAFRAHAGDRRITGAFRWAEGDTVLVLSPDSPLQYGARIVLSVESGARAQDGATLANARSATFTVQRRVSPAQRRKPPATGRQSSAWRWPLIGPITQRFGESLTKYGFHYGIDIDGATGDPVRAARRGRVVVAGSYDQCGGLEVHIDHGNGIASWYRHLSRVQVNEGSVVDAGTIIGRVGNTGCSLGSHLHFAIRKGSRFVDPLLYLPHR